MRSVSMFAFMAAAVALGGLSALAPSRASACIQWICGDVRLLPSGGSVPRDLPGFLWVPYEPSAPPDDGGVWRPTAVDVSLEGPSGEVAVSLDDLGDGAYLIRPAQALASGQAYTVTLTDACGGGVDVVTVNASTPAPLPQTLGALAVLDEGRQWIDVGTAVGSCSTSVDAATATVEIALDAAAAPWADVLAYETRVDGAAWAPVGSIVQRIPLGSSWVGRARDRVYAICGANEMMGFPGVSEGTHTIEMRATIPGTALTLATNSVTVELTCDGPRPDGDGGVCPSGSCGGPGPDGGGGACPSGSCGGPGPDGGGGACAVGGRGGAPLGAWLLVAGALFALRRRQAGRARSAPRTSR